jgi:hypothetical protein
LTDLVKIAGTRWKVEGDFQDSQSTVSLDQTQVRLYCAWKRHVTCSPRCHPPCRQHAARAQITRHLNWSTWRRRHQARARWHHYRTRLALIA